jgi:signal transduction histidine kinase
MRATFGNLTTEKKLGTAFAVALVTIAGLAFTLYRSTQDLFRSNKQVANTLELMVALGNTLSHINEAETAQRGYILTGDRKFLDPYPGAIEAVKRELATLSLLTAGNPTQRAALNKLNPLIEERIARMQDSIHIREERGFEPALEVIVTKKGNEIMHEIRGVIHEMQTEEEATLDRRYNRSKQNFRNTLIGFIAVVLLNFVLLSLAYVIVRRDLIARQRNIEQQTKLVRSLETANQQLREFAHVVSHDLKAPLRGIHSLSTFLTLDYSDKLDEAGKENLSLLNRRVQRMHDLIEGILQYSQLAQGDEQKQSVNLNKLVREIWEMLAAPSRVRLIVERPLPTIVCDGLRTQQILQNLLSNAIKYNDKPAGLVHLQWTEKADRWVFSVSDNGPGIEAKYFSKIFQLFQTLQARDDQESTGIGLAVVKKAVEMSGGKVWVESKVGDGTTFFFSLPKRR